MKNIFKKVGMAGMAIFIFAAAWAPVRRSLGVGGVMPAGGAEAALKNIK